MLYSNAFRTLRDFIKIAVQWFQTVFIVEEVKFPVHIKIGAIIYVEHRHSFSMHVQKQNLKELDPQCGW